MIVPLTSHELNLIRLLVNDEHAPDMLQRLRDVLMEMYVSGSISEQAVDDLMVRLYSRAAQNRELRAFHEETHALLRAAVVRRAAG